MPTQILEFSAGGVVLNKGQVLLIRTLDLKGGRVWTFPKGKLNENETSPQAALREVEEETGWRCRIGAELPRSQYWFQREGRRVKKTVRWFRMVPLDQVGENDEEVEEVAWVPVREAMDRLTYDADRGLLRCAVAMPETDGAGGQGSSPQSNSKRAVKKRRVGGS